jgi:hypothetical protein
VRKLYEGGARTVSWEADDPDADVLSYALEIRREGTSVWVPLARDLEESFHGWDARAWSDGLYRVRLTADDAKSNPDGKELREQRTSEIFRIDNTRPTVSDPRIDRNGRGLRVDFVATDSGGNVAAVEVALDAEDWQPLRPLDGVADSAEERYELRIEPRASPPRTVRVRVTDSSGNLGGDAWAFE